jgi:hypothetical protein
MSRSLRRPVEDFEAVFRALSLQKESVILVGGHDVNVWALNYAACCARPIFAALRRTFSSPQENEVMPSANGGEGGGFAALRGLYHL